MRCAESTCFPADSLVRRLGSRLPAASAATSASITTTTAHELLPISRLAIGDVVDCVLPDGSHSACDVFYYGYAEGERQWPYVHLHYSRNGSAARMRISAEHHLALAWQHVDEHAPSEVGTQISGCPLPNNMPSSCLCVWGPCQPRQLSLPRSSERRSRRPALCRLPAMLPWASCCCCTSQESASSRRLSPTSASATTGVGGWRDGSSMAAWQHGSMPAAPAHMARACCPRSQPGPALSGFHPTHHTPPLLAGAYSPMLSRGGRLLVDGVVAHTSASFYVRPAAELSVHGNYLLRSAVEQVGGGRPGWRSPARA